MPVLAFHFYPSNVYSMDRPMKPCQECKNLYLGLPWIDLKPISLGKKLHRPPCHLRIHARVKKASEDGLRGGWSAGIRSLETGRNGSSHVQTASEGAAPWQFCFFWPFQRDLRPSPLLLNIKNRKHLGWLPFPLKQTPTGERRRRELPSADSTCQSLIPVHSTEYVCIPVSWGLHAAQNLRVTVWLPSQERCLVCPVYARPLECITRRMYGVGIQWVESAPKYRCACVRSLASIRAD
ncbi:hypothetical protein BJX96DRAFT_127982 [Aspergillus floccosus]